MSRGPTAPDSEREVLREGAALTLRALRDAPFGFTVGGLGAALYAGMTVLSAVVLGQLVTDRVLVPAFRQGEVAAGALGLAVGAVLGVSALKAAGIFGRRFGAYHAQYQLQAQYRRAVTDRYLSLPLTWHRRHATGELLSNAHADVEAAWFVAAPLPMSFGAVLMLLGLAVLLVVTDPYLAAIGFALGPAIGVTNYHYQRRQRVAARLAQQARADVSERAHESFDAALVVKTLGREDAETTRFGDAADDLRERMIEVGRLRALFDPVVEALPNLGILAVLLVGAWRVRGGALSPGDLVQFAFLFRLVALPMRVFGWFLGELPRALVGWRRVSRVLATEGGMEYGSVPTAGEGGAQVGTLEVGYHHPAGGREDLSTGATTLYGDGDPAPRGVSDVTFDIPAGSTVAVIGPTGAGKSTIAGLLVRLYDPDTGRITYDGTPLEDLRRDGLAQDAVIALQETFLFDDTVRENIALDARVSDDEVVAAAEVARAHTFVRRLENGYDTVVGERGASLSGGQRQRIALARAVVRRPRLLVLDDATSAVDPAVEAAILEGLATTDHAATVIVVAHRPATAALADEVLFVRGGTVVARGTHEELLAEQPDYAALLTVSDGVGPR